MGKRKDKSSGYTHKKTYNKAARESDDRRANQMTHMTVTRLKKAVEKQTRHMTYYIPVETKKKPRLDPNFNLKGAARPALDFYKDPNFDYSEPEGVNLMTQYEDGKMWQHVEGQKLLEMTLELGVALHNIANKPKDAIKTFNSILAFDSGDHLRARHALLRCYLDEGYGLEARALIERYPEDTSGCFTFGLALLDHVAYYLNEEEGCTLEAANQSLAKAFAANNYTAWVIALRPFFKECVELVGGGELMKAVSTAEGEFCPGGMLDALLFHEEDAEIWAETDGATEWVLDFLQSNKLEFTNPGTFLGLDDDEDDDDEEEEEEEEAEENNDKDDAKAATAVSSQADVSLKRKSPSSNTSSSSFSEEQVIATQQKQDEEIEAEDDDVERKTDAEIMYLNMYRTAVKMAAASAASTSQEGSKTQSTVAAKLLKHLNTLPIFDSLIH